jgi:hypothetical protein
MPSFHLGKWIAYTFFFLVLFVPLTHRPIKAILLGLVLGMIIISILVSGKIFLHRTILLWTFLIVLSGLVFFLVGVLNDAAGVLRVSHIYVLWPLVFVLLVAGITNERIIRGLIKVLIFTTIAISLYALIDIATIVGWLPDIFPIIVDKGQRVGFHQGFVHYTTPSIYTLLFAVPFLISALMIWPKSRIMPVSRRWLWIALILSLAMTLLSARRALWIVIALSPFLTIMLHMLSRRHHRFSNRKLVRRSFAKLILIISLVYFSLHFIFEIDYFAMIQHLVASFQVAIDYGATVRAEQFFALWRGWLESPLIGSGLGAVAEGSIRCVYHPWQYELFYLSLLFHTGIIGVIIYSAAVAWVYQMGFKMIRSGEHLGLYMLPILVGTSSFLIASGTNPYFGTFSGIWPIYLPIALINVWLLARRNIVYESQLPRGHFDNGEGFKLN